MISGLRARPALFALLPPATYALAYAYLAWYHDSVFLLRTVVHANGRYTLFEHLLDTAFFALLCVLLMIPADRSSAYMSCLLRPTMHPRRFRFLTLGCSTYCLARSHPETPMGTASFAMQKRGVFVQGQRR